MTLRPRAINTAVSALPPHGVGSGHVRGTARFAISEARRTEPSRGADLVTQSLPERRSAAPPRAQPRRKPRPRGRRKRGVPLPPGPPAAGAPWGHARQLMAAGGPGRREEMAPPSPYVHSMPAWVLEDFCQKMDCLSDSDWMRFGERGSPRRSRAPRRPPPPPPRLPIPSASGPAAITRPPPAAADPHRHPRGPPVQRLPSAATTGT